MFFYKRQIIIKKKWKLKHQVLHGRYTTLIILKIPYGASSGLVSIDRSGNTINPIGLQRILCFGIKGAMRTIPREALNIFGKPRHLTYLELSLSVLQ